MQEISVLALRQGQRVTIMSLNEEILTVGFVDSFKDEKDRITYNLKLDDGRDFSTVLTETHLLKIDESESILKVNIGQ